MLAVNDVFVRVLRSCSESGLSLATWTRAEQLAARFAQEGFVPDAYFKISWQRGEQIGAVSFFLEVERAVKSRKVLESKLRRYSDYLSAGRFRQHFGATAPQLLLVYTTEADATAATRVRSAVELAEQLGLRRVLFASLEAICQALPTELLTRPLWWQPGRPAPLALFASGSGAQSGGMTAGRLDR